MSNTQYPVALVWQEMLSGIFSTLGRLACLASHRDPLTGRYHHSRLTKQLGNEEADDAMRVAHELLWRDWMAGSLEQQHADTILYLHDLSTNFERLLALWLESAPFVAFVPSCANEAERALFIGNLKLLLTLLHNSYATTPSYAGISLGQQPRHSVWEQATRIVRERYSDPTLSLRAVSVALNISRRDLGMMFKAQTSRPFRQYLRDVRIQHAAELLTTSPEGVKAISAPYCKRFAGFLDDLTPEERAKLQITYRQLPLNIHSWAQDAAALSACVALQDKAAFWKLHDFLFSNQQALSKETLVGKALEFLSQDKAVDPQRVTSCLAEKAFQESLQRDQQLAMDLGINSTPTIFLNGGRISVRSVDDLRKAMWAGELESAAAPPLRRALQ